MIIPKNHPTYEFPYNLSDKIEHIINLLNKEINFKFDYKIEENVIKKHSMYVERTYKIIISNSKELKEYSNILKNNKAILIKDKWVITIK